MKEFIYDYEEFKKLIDHSKPIHHIALHRYLDEFGMFRELKFRIYAISEEYGHILIFECVERFATTRMKAMEVYNKLVEKYAKPLGSTEGRLE